tara:strand:- start:848 stop:1210 length:363 start_codon:yes stop_codon:yes gene_type:complete
MADAMQNVITDAKLITCILPKGRAADLQQALIDEKGIHNANYHHARGVGRFSPISARGIGEQQAKEILEIAVSAEQADELFEFMFFEGGIDEPHGGIIFVTSLPSATQMSLPDDLPEEDS